MKEKNPLDEYFKKGLEGHETKPSASVWDKIEAANDTTESSRRSGGGYFMRAAVITLLVGLSTWVFYQNQSFDTGPDPINISHSPTTDDDTNSEEKGPDKEKSEQTPQPEKKTEKSAPDPKKSEQKQAIPVMKPPVKGGIYVSNEAAVPEVINESVLEEENDWQPTELALNVQEEQPYEVAPVKVKLRLKPATTPAFYSDQAVAKEDQRDFKERLYAYANSQFDNLIKGRPLELPKPERKPQLEINLGNFFNN